jgi:sugar phosphate isomerase/epimerase
LSRVQKIDRTLHWNLFKESLQTILDKTKHLGLDFLVENNVLAKMNVYEDGTNPLLCVDAAEMIRLMLEMKNDRLGILLDTAHLKVSALTLNFNADEAVEKIAPYIKCIHHSDNEGVYDNNMPLENGYWFLGHQHKFKDILHVVEVKKLEVDKIAKHVELIETN